MHPDPQWIGDPVADALKKVDQTLPTASKESDRSDRRQLAHAVAKGAEFFVTRDEALLDRADALRAAVGIEVLRPADLLVRVYADQIPHGYARARRVGTIPGARHIDWRRHLDADGAYLPADEVRALYQSEGVTPDKTIIPYCQGGYRSASTALVLRMLGYPDVRNYLGSWWEWGNRDDSVIVLNGEDA